MAETINNSSNVKVDEITKVTPSSDSLTASTFPLTYIDISWFNILPVERLFFYQITDLTSDLFNSVIVPKLKHSLSLTLLHYLPLAGNIMWPSDAAKPAVYYFPSDGVPVTIAVSDGDFNLLSGNGVSKAVELHPLVPQLSISDDKAEVIAIQITLFPNEGFSIGVTSHHGVVDGKSSTMFVRSWAYLCKQLLSTHNQEQSQPCLPSDLTPFCDRTVIKGPKDQDMGKYFIKQSLKVSPMSSSVDVNKLVRATFVLTREDVKKLRENVMNRSNQLHLSTFVVTLAYVFVCMVKAKIEEGNSSNNENVVIGFTADYRSRLDPPVPHNYFGNCVGIHADAAKASDVTRENGYAFASEMLSDCVKSIDADDATEGSNDKRIAKVKELVKEGAVRLSVSGSTRLDVYGSDFGWGRPKKVEVVSIDRTDAVSLAEARDGGGGVEVGVALKKQEMDVFASLFADGLKK